MNLITITIDADKEVVVPREPTAEMVEAGAKAANYSYKPRDLADEFGGDGDDWPETHTYPDADEYRACFAAAYRAGITAAPTRQQAAMDDGEQITHEQALVSAQKFIAHFFGNDDPKPTVRIPADPSRDDDLLLTRYIRQQQSRTSLGRELTGVGE